MQGEVARVVALRKGKVRPVEFQIRDGEWGLSLFHVVDEPNLTEVVQAVRHMGKQGDLRPALLSANQIESLGLKLISTPGGTASPRVNRIHLEARMRFWRQLVTRLQGIELHKYFNETFSPKLCAFARVVEVSP